MVVADELDLTPLYKGQQQQRLQQQEKESVFFLWLPILFLWRSVHRVTFITICAITIIWSSAFIYITLYYLYIPTMSHRRVVNLQFDSRCATQCLEPFAMVPLSDHRTATIFNRGQQYEFTVELHLPESDVNWDQGMFMVTIELYDLESRLISKLSRSAILKYKSPLLRILQIAVYWPLLVTGFKQEDQFMSLTVVDNYIDGTAPGVGSASLAKVKLEARQIQVYSSNLIIEAKLRGLRYFMVHWPLSSALLGILSIMSFLTMVTVLSVYRVVSARPEDQSVPKSGSMIRMLEEKSDESGSSGSSSTAQLLEGEMDEVYEFPDSTTED